MVSGNYFTMLGVKPALGRVFSSEEDDRVVSGPSRGGVELRLLGDRFARDPKVIGKKILVNNYPMTIVGVSAAGFAGLDPAQVAADPRADSDEAGDDAGVVVVQAGRPRATRWVQVFARLKPGYTPESAQAPHAGAVPANPGV